jgi:hypothetical protein
MNWSREIQEQGFYWWRRNPEDKSMIVVYISFTYPMNKVLLSKEINIHFPGSVQEVPIGFINGQFYGPLTPPIE